ncbi:YfhO family protein [Streptomyces sp. NBC_01465]|uniref:YfhO family protein n=1 Tax=Streptomyces sp. NBC_01465 TaxID=2903878 RepID=UPI002E37C18B|nr:YfhO family protein [Streptomyces sp. NBC_01465]
MPTLQATRRLPRPRRSDAPAAPSPRTRPRARAAGLAALITVVAVCGADAVARVAPFGHHRRSVNDLGNEYVPFHAHLWDLLHGRADGGLLFNWQSGYGTSFLPDLGTYLSSPFALLVGLFPRDRIDLAVYVVTVLKMASAAAAMTVLLLALHDRGRHRWLAGVLGASYALCGWSILEGTYNTMWLDGLIAFPLLCLVGEWARTGRHRVVGPLVVALAWTANFYTAYMATIGAGLVLVVRLVLEEPEIRNRMRALLRAARSVVIGIALSAPLLFTVYLGTKNAYPGRTTEFRPVGLPGFLARLLPATYAFSSPALFVGSGTLLLACALAFHRAVPVRERYAWPALAVLVALSLQWKPTHLMWHAFVTPNGSPYRETFVLCGILVITAWSCVSYELPGRRALFGGGGVLLLAAAGAAFSEKLVSHWTYPVFAAGLAASAAGLLIGRRRGFGRISALLLVAALVGQAAVTVAYGDRERLARLDDYPVWGAEHTARARAVSGTDGWPGYRSDPGRTQLTGNDPLLVGGQGGAYYSSMTPDVLTRTLAALGGGWTSRGRNLQSLDNPVTDAIFAVGARAHWEKGGPTTVSRETVPPLVTVRPPGPRPHFTPSPFRNQEALLGAKVYVQSGRGVKCPAGTQVFLWAPNYFGEAGLGTDSAGMRGGLPARRAALQPLGTAPGKVAVHGPRDGLTGCLDPAALTTAVDRLRATGATSVHVTDTSIRAELPPGSRGTAVFAMPAVEGWSCRAGDGPDRPAAGYLGLVSVPLDGSAASVGCTFRPPGLTAGLWTGALALLGLLATGLVPVALARRRTVTKSSSA